MVEHAIPTSATPTLIISECVGDLTVRGSDERQLYLRYDDEDMTLETDGDSFTLTSRSDCTLTCPAGTALTIHTVRGDLRVERVQGPVAIDGGHGYVILRDVGPTTLGQAYGDLTVRYVAGELQVGTVQGDARIGEIDGLCAVEQVGSDLKASGLHSGLTARWVGADVWLGPPFSPDAVYHLSAGSDLKLYLPADADLCLDLHAGGGVHSHVPGLILAAMRGAAQAVLGAGAARLEARVAGHVSLWPLPEGGLSVDQGLPDLDGLAMEIESRIAEAMAGLETRLQRGLSRLDSESLRQRVADKARQKAEREAERARLRAEQAERRWQRASGRRARPRRQQVSDEERLRVLRLVEEGRISPAEAADLLAALEGR